MDVVQKNRERWKQIDCCEEVKVGEINRRNNNNQSSKRLCLQHLFFQSCLYTHWKSAHNRSILSVIIDSQQPSASTTPDQKAGFEQDDNRKDRISWPTNKVEIEMRDLDCYNWGYWKTPNLCKMTNHR